MAYIDELYNHQMSSNTKHTRESTFLKIFLDWWAFFKSLYPSYDTDYYNDVVAKTP